jgi:hypothetical protein
LWSYVISNFIDDVKCMRVNTKITNCTVVSAGSPQR